MDLDFAGDIAKSAEDNETPKKTERFVRNRAILDSGLALQCRSHASRRYETKRQHLHRNGLYEVVNSFTYFCSKVTSNSDAEAIVCPRIAKATTVFGRLSPLSALCYFSSNVKLRLYSSIVPTATYASKA